MEKIVADLENMRLDAYISSKETRLSRTNIQRCPNIIVKSQKVFPLILPLLTCFLRKNTLQCLSVFIFNKLLVQFNTGCQAIYVVKSSLQKYS